MEIIVSGRQVAIGQAFQEYATERLRALADKYFARALDAQVTLAHGAHGHGFHVDCAMHVRQGVSLKADGSASDANAALDNAVLRIEKQLRRYKRRLKNHHNEPLKEINVASVNGYIVQHMPEAEDVPEQGPIIIAETKVDVPEVSVSDAVMLMDLAHAPALLFRDAATRHYAMVYHRSDGNIGWVETATP